MALLDYTTFDDVRAALGVSSDELEDATLSLSLYEFSLKDELVEVAEEVSSSADLSADFSAANVKTPENRTADEQKLIEAVRLFATYQVAHHCLAALPLFSPKEQHDGKAAVIRFAQNPYADTIKGVQANYGKYKEKLLTAYRRFKSASTPTTTARTFFAASTPSSDPVTG